MRVSIIVPTYKDIKALELILEALKRQTYTNFEVCVAEDDEASQTVTLLKKYEKYLSIQHFTQEDKGNRKALVMNKALREIQSEYLIFIDGDTIPYTTFIESHIALSEKKVLLCGRRVNLGDKVSSELREGTINSYELEKNYLLKYNYIKDDNSRHFEQGLRLSPHSFIYKTIQSLNKNVHIVGSNFSCFREDMEVINGFDEDIIGGSKDDVDLEWRFVMSGCHLVSCKYCANLFHLNHSRSSRIEDEMLAKVMMDTNKDKGIYRAKNGILKECE